MMRRFRVSNLISLCILTNRHQVSLSSLRLLSSSPLNNDCSNGGGSSVCSASSSPLSGSSDGDGDNVLLDKIKTVFDRGTRRPNSDELDNIRGRGERGQAVAELTPPPSSLPEDADEILRKMKETVLIPRTVAMLQGLYNDGLEHEAMKLFGQMRERGTIPEVVVYTVVVEEFCKAQKLDDAKRIFGEMQSNGVIANAFSYGVLIQALCKGDRLDDALKLCSEMVEAGLHPNLATFKALLNEIYREKGKGEGEDEAMVEHLDLQEDDNESFRIMKETGFIPNAAAMLHGLCRDGSVQEALKLFDLIRERETIPEVVLCTTVVEGFCNHQKFDHAKRIFKKMQSNGVVANAFSYGILVQGLCKGKMLDDALEFCLEMVEAGHSPNLATFTRLVDGFCTERGVEAAKVMISNLRIKGFCFDENAVRGFLDKKGPFSPLVWQAIFTKTSSLSLPLFGKNGSRGTSQKPL